MDEALGIEKKRAALDAAMAEHEDAMIALDVVERVEERARRVVEKAALAISGETWDRRRSGLLAPSGASAEIRESRERVRAARANRLVGSGSAPAPAAGPDDAATS